jgi:oxaloacetate decarboxylase gamma subunit
MTIAEMLQQSGVLTLLGMGIVFGFLIIMVIAVSMMGRIIHALGADRDAAPQPKPPAAGVKTTAETAAISAAVSEYRKTENR